MQRVMIPRRIEPSGRVGGSGAGTSRIGGTLLSSPGKLREEAELSPCPRAQVATVQRFKLRDGEMSPLRRGAVQCAEWRGATVRNCRQPMRRSMRVETGSALMMCRRPLASAGEDLAQKSGRPDAWNSAGGRMHERWRSAASNHSHSCVRPGMPHSSARGDGDPGALSSPSPPVSRPVCRLSIAGPSSIHGFACDCQQI